jgi:lipoprotein-anchoring transpeptidase ErfK/SrfK
VHVSLFQGDGQTYGIGFAIIAQFNVAHRPVQRRATDSVAFTHAVAVNVNGQPAGGAWFGQKSEIPGYAVDALYRRQHSWSARCAHHRGSAVEGAVGRSLGCPTTSLTSSMRTGPANVSTVDSTTHQMAVTSDGKVARTMPVSLGSGGHPTFTGTKVVMEKDKPARMVSSPGEAYYNVLVPWSVRITDSGEFIHAASWNTANIGSRNTPHGCTNLHVGDAEWFYEFSQLGDVVQYPNASGPTQPWWDGWGWWNLPWSQWAAGGPLLNLLRTGSASRTGS